MSSWNRRPALVAALLVAGCTTVGPNFTTPKAPPASGYLMHGDKAPAEATLTASGRPAGAWWRSLGSPRLDAVMDQALRDNQTVAMAEATLEKAQDQVGASRGALAPQVTGNAMAERERINIASFGFTGFPNPTINLFSIGAAVSYDLDLFGGGRRKVETAEAVAEAAGHRADAAYLTLTGNVALQAIRMAAVRAQMEAVQAIIADDRQNLDIIHRAQAAGGEAPAVSSGGLAQLAADQALLPPLAQQISQARHALAQLVGQAPSEWTPPDFTVAEFTPPSPIPVTLPSTLVRRRPDILAAEADLHADTARIGVATADLYPDIKLGAAFTQSALTPTSLFGYDASGWNFGPSVTLPIFNGGRLRAEKHAAEAQARASLAQYRQTVLTAFTQVSDVMTALAHDDERLAASDAAQAAAQMALDDARKAYGLGGGPLSNVVNASRQLHRARLDVAQAQAQKLMDVVELYAVTATDWRAAA